MGSVIVGVFVRMRRLPPDEAIVASFCVSERCQNSIVTITFTVSSARSCVS